jgi:transposase
VFAGRLGERVWVVRIFCYMATHVAQPRLGQVLPQQRRADVTPLAAKAKSSAVTLQQQQQHQQQRPDSSGVDQTEALAALRAFDLNSDFGPCLGVSRRQRWGASSTRMRCPPAHAVCACRWERAERLGLKPPTLVKRYLDELGSDDTVQQCLWTGNPVDMR